MIYLWLAIGLLTFAVIFLGLVYIRMEARVSRIEHPPDGHIRGGE